MFRPRTPLLEATLTDSPQAAKDTPSANTSGNITDWVKPGDTSGEFKRQQSSFRNWISREAGAQFPPEKGRYHLYVSYACPWVSTTVQSSLRLPRSARWRRLIE